LPNDEVQTFELLLLAESAREKLCLPVYAWQESVPHKDAGKEQPRPWQGETFTALSPRLAGPS